MKRLCTLIIFASASLMLSIGAMADAPRFSNVEYQGMDPWFVDNQPADGEMYSLLLQGCYPDPSICRRGDDYYMVCSSMAMFPAVPIFHSNDLVNWSQIGHVLDRPSQMMARNADTSQGIMAPTIRYNERNNTFYMITTQGSGGPGNMLVKTADPYQGWSDPIPLGFDGIDPSLFFDDDGGAYIVHNDEPEGGSLWDGHRAIRLWEYDLVGDSLIQGSSRIIVNGGTRFERKPFWVEAPHIYKKEGLYYLVCAEGGTGDTHSEVVFVSENVDGPYREAPNNPILSQRHLNPDRCNKVEWAGHADLVSTPAGEWYAVYLAIRPNPQGHTLLGRETFIIPVDWSGMWPVFENGLSPHEPIIPMPAQAANHQGEKTFLPVGNYDFSDFTDQTESISGRWVGIRAFPAEVASLQDDGAIVLQPNPCGITEIKPLSALWMRQMHDNFSFSVDMVFLPSSAGDFAGVACLQSSKANYVFGLMSRDGQPILVLKRNWDGEEEIIAEQPIALDAKLPKIRLRISSADEQYQFSYSLSGGEYVSIATPQRGDILSTHLAGGFVGNLLGLFTSR